MDFFLCDLLVLEISYFLGLIIRNGIVSRYSNYLGTAVILAIIGALVPVFMNSYSGILRRGYLKEFKNVIIQVVVVFFCESLYLFLSQNAAQFSRLAFLYFILICVPLTYIERIILKKFIKSGTREAKRSMLIYTTYDQAEEVVENIRKSAYDTCQIIGLVLMDRDDFVGKTIADTEVVCKAAEVLDYIQNLWIDEVFINISRKVTGFPQELLIGCRDMGIKTMLNLSTMSGTGEFNHRCAAIAEFGPYTVIERNLRMITDREALMKRTIDIVGSAVGLVFTGILTVIIGPMIFAASPGPIFFSQIRIGKNGKPFRCYKFRSMYPDAEARKAKLMEQNQMSGAMFKMEHDPRIIGAGPDGTKKGIGHFIRKYSIDEFPQFWNVFKGDMSLVGTRPPTENEWQQYEKHHRARLAVKPGITGLWQTQGRNEIFDFEKVVALDLQYIETWSVGEDIKILAKTIGEVFRGSGK